MAVTPARLIPWMALVWLGCGDQEPAGPDAATGRADARQADAPIDAADAGPSDASGDAPDAAPDLDRDHDGISNDADCAPDDPMRWRQVSIWIDGDGDLLGGGDPSPACIGLEPPAGTVLVGGDCDDGNPLLFQLLSFAARDADGDHRYVAATGEVCSGFLLPTGYRASVPDGEPDCDDDEAARYRTVALFLDEDGDHVGVGIPAPRCIGAVIPDQRADVDGDCADDNGAIWQLLRYQHRDADGDGFTVPETGEVCSGASLPPGYRTTANGADCDDDSNARWRMVDLFEDSDHDGVGAGPPTAMCIGATAPEGRSLTNTDCAPVDGDRWRLLPYAHVDRDEDGATTPETGSECSGNALLPPFYAAARGNDCDDTKKELTRYVVLYPDGDGDGVGRLPSQIQCLGAAIPEGFSTGGYDVDDEDPAVIEDEEEDDLTDLILM